MLVLHSLSSHCFFFPYHSFLFQFSLSDPKYIIESFSSEPRSYSLYPVIQKPHSLWWLCLTTPDLYVYIWPLSWVPLAQSVGCLHSDALLSIWIHLCPQICYSSGLFNFQFWSDYFPISPVWIFLAILDSFHFLFFHISTYGVLPSSLRLVQCRALITLHLHLPLSF